MFPFPCCQPSSTQVRAPLINSASEQSDAMFDDMVDTTAMDLCHGEQKSYIIDDLVPRPFKQTDPRAPKCRNMGTPALKDLLLQANGRIAFLEGLCARSRDELSKLHHEQYSTSQNLSYACDQINELQRELDETIVTVTKNATLLDDYRNNRVVPCDVMMESEHGPESTLIQKTLNTIAAKNVEILQLRQQLATPLSTASTTTPSSSSLVKDCSESLARLANYMKRRDYTMGSQRMLDYSSQRYVSELASEGGDQFLVFLMTVIDNADTLSRKHIIKLIDDKTNTIPQPDKIYYTYCILFWAWFQRKKTKRVHYA